jgi:carboxylesterase
MSFENTAADLLQDWQADGHGVNAKIGVLLVHGFTGSPAAVRPWAQYLHNRGYSVKVPLLPGHGTEPKDLNAIKWEEWPAKVESELQSLLLTCEKVFLVGFSMGGTTSLNVAARYSDQLTGLILVNPMIHLRFVTPQLAWLVSRFRKFRTSVGDDIKRPGVTELGYDATPIVGVYQLLKMCSKTRNELAKVSLPVQLFHSVEDHTLPVSNTEIIMREIGSQEKNRIELVNSYHVAPLDYDAEIIFENSRIFIESHS